MDVVTKPRISPGCGRPACRRNERRSLLCYVARVSDRVKRVDRAAHFREELGIVDLRTQGTGVGQTQRRRGRPSELTPPASTWVDACLSTN